MATRLAFLATAVLLFSSAALGQGTDFTWVNTGGGIFGDGLNWDLLAVPSAADRAVFSLPNAFTVRHDAGYTNDQVLVDQGQVTFDLSGATYSVAHENTDGQVAVAIGDRTGGAFVSAALTALNGNVDSKDILLGHWYENTGSLTVGAGAHWTAFAYGLFVDQGQGFLTVRDGGRLEHGHGLLAQGVDSVAAATITGAGSLWNVTGDFTIAERGTATVSVLNGARALMGRVTLGTYREGPPTALGTLVVDGPGSMFEVIYGGDDALNVGADSDGAVLVRNGGEISVTGGIELGLNSPGAGALTLTGAGSRATAQAAVDIGLNGNGQLLVAAGGVLTGARTVTLGRAGGSSGSATVTGIGSRLNAGGQVVVGDAGGGSMLIADGGVVACVGALIAKLPGSRGDVVVDGVGSLWSSTGDLSVGTDDPAGSAGTLTLRNGGRAWVQYTSWVFPHSSLTLDGGQLQTWVLMSKGLITGNGAVANAADFVNDVTGEVRLGAGQRITFEGAPNTNHGRITLQGGAAEFAQPVLNDTSGLIQGRGTFTSAGLTQNGTMSLSAGATDVYGTVSNGTGGKITVSGQANVTFWNDVHNAAGAQFKVSSGSAATFFGTFSGTGITGGGHTYFEGGVVPGFSPAAITLGGDTTFGPAARLDIELGGKTSGTGHDQVGVPGTAALDGTLAVTTIGGFLPLPGESFRVLTCGERAGEFAAATGTTGVGGFAGLWLDVQYDDTGVSLLPRARGGDATLDAIVDVSDLAVLAGRYGTFSASYTWRNADFNHDGWVDVSDLAVLAGNYGKSSPDGGVPVPEPATLVLLALGAAVAGVRR